ncbi:MAG: antirepressor regulating drug resistance protein [Clostridiales bacterium]|jgi:beta-lactamase regulating signal transducer with metallopeptidase domain|nr:antirepressor regulating drug resistance protein [Clostridiales bacterium]
MADFAYWLLNMSIAGSLGCLVILFVRSFKKIPRRLIKILWFIPVIRFLIPIGVTGRFSIFNLLSGYVVKTVEVNDTMKVSISNYLQQADEYFPIVYRNNVLRQIFQVSFIIWGILASALLITFAIMYLMAGNELKSAVRLEGNVYCSSAVSTGAVYGTRKPKIILPVNMKEESRQFVLKHEQMHIRKYDNLYRCIVILTACIHWFNPFVWIMLKNSLDDLELACDEAVIQGMEAEEQKKYAMTILNEAATPRFVVTSFGGAKVKVRIQNILNYKKITVFSSICFAIFCLLIFIILLTNAEV